MMSRTQHTRYIPGGSSLLESLEAARAVRIARAKKRAGELAFRLTGNPDLYNELTAAPLPEEATA